MQVITALNFNNDMFISNKYTVVLIVTVNMMHKSIILFIYSFSQGLDMNPEVIRKRFPRRSRFLESTRSVSLRAGSFTSLFFFFYGSFAM